LTPQIVSDPPTRPAMRPGFYGYGFNVGTSSAGRTQFSHSGAFNLGAATNFVVIPSADVAIVALTNAAPSGVPETLTAEFGDLVQFGEVREDWRKLYAAAFAPMEQPSGVLVGKSPPDKPAPARPLTEKDRQLSLTIGPRPVVYPLRHWDGDVFTFGLSNENASPGSISQAVFDGDTLTLEYYDADKMGTFTR
jgi:hypothetical protein